MNEIPVKLPLSETMESAWRKVKGTKSTFFGVLICILVLELIDYCLDKATHTPDGKLITNAFRGIFSLRLLIGIIVLFLSWGFIYMGVQRAMGLPIQFGMLKHVFKIGIFFRMLALIIIKVIIFFTPFALLLLPKAYPSFLPLISSDAMSIIKLLSALTYLISFALIIYAINLLVRLSLAAPSIILKRSGLWAAIKTSYQATKSNVWRLIALYFVNAIIVLLSAIPAGIGLIWTYPYFYILYGEVYKKLVVSRFSS